MEKERPTSAAAGKEFEYDDEEEKKMDKFYELIRRFNEARDHHRRSFLQFRHQNQPQSNQNDANFQTKKKNNNNDMNYYNCNNKGLGSATEDAHTIWMPSFKLEDFRQVFSHYQENHQDQQAVEVVSPKKTAINFLQLYPEKSNFNINDLKKKRKMGDVNDDNDGDITTADHYKHASPRLDLNLAL